MGKDLNAALFKASGIWMEELSETARNKGQQVGVSHEIQKGHFRMQVRRHTAWTSLLD